MLYSLCAGWEVEGAGGGVEAEQHGLVPGVAGHPGHPVHAALLHLHLRRGPDGSMTTLNWYCASIARTRRSSGRW